MREWQGEKMLTVLRKNKQKDQTTCLRNVEQEEVPSVPDGFVIYFNSHTLKQRKKERIQNNWAVSVDHLEQKKARVVSTNK